MASPASTESENEDHGEHATSSPTSKESDNEGLKTLATNPDTSTRIKNRKKNTFSVRRWVRLFRRIPKPRPALTALETCILSLHKRAKFHTWLSVFDMLGIFSALHLLVSGFVLSDRIARLEESALESEAQQQESQERIAKILDAADKFKFGLAGVEIDPNNHEPGINALQQRIVEFQTALPEPPSLSRAPVSDAKFIAQSASVLLSRAVILACGLLFIQILVSRYKFNSKMAGQYEAMADALFLATDTNELKFEQLISTLMPKMEFGSMPKSMIQELLETLKSGAEAAKKG